MIKINSDHTSIRWDREPKDILLTGSSKANWLNYFGNKIKYSHTL